MTDRVENKTYPPPRGYVMKPNGFSIIVAYILLKKQTCRLVVNLIEVVVIASENLSYIELRYREL